MIIEMQNNSFLTSLVTSDEISVTSGAENATEFVHVAACSGSAGTFGTLGCACGCAATFGTLGTYGCGE